MRWNQCLSAKKKVNLSCLNCIYSIDVIERIDDVVVVSAVEVG